MVKKVENQLKTLNKNLSAIVEFIEKLDTLSKKANSAGQTIEKSFEKSSKVMKKSSDDALIVAENLLKLNRAANTLQQGILNANVSLSDQNSFLTELSASQNAAARRIQSFEGDIDEIREAFVDFGNETLKVSKILNDQKRQTKESEQATRSEIAAVKDLTKEKISRTVAESAALEKLKALQSEEGKLLSISGAQADSVRQATEAYENYVAVLQRTGSTSEESAKAKAEFTSRINDSRRLLRNSTTRMQEFNVASQNLTKSVQVALGPLSGIAARLTALTALFNKNTASAAATIGAMTGFTVAARKLVGIGIEYERQMLRMEATTMNLGRAANFTVGQLESLAQSLAASTLASVAQTRELVTILNTFGGIAPDVFERTAQAAIGMANVFGGAVETNARQLGRLLEDPLRNMDALRRTGIQFTQDERRRLEVLRRTFRAQEAQNMVLDKFNTIIGVSQGQARGLAGQLDTTQQIFQNFTERLAVSSGITQRVADQIELVNKALSELLSNEELILKFGNSLAAFAETGARVLAFLAENIEGIAVAARIALTVFIALTGATIIKLITTLTLGKAGIVGLVGAFKLLASVLRGPGGIIGIKTRLIERITTLLKSTQGYQKIVGTLSRVAGRLGLIIGTHIGVHFALNRELDRGVALNRQYANEMRRFSDIVETLPQPQQERFTRELGAIAEEYATTFRTIARLRQEEEEAASQMRGPFGFGEPRARREQRAAQQERLEGIQEAIKEEEAYAKLLMLRIRVERNAAAETSRILSEAFGDKGMEGGIQFLRNLEQSFLPLRQPMADFEKDLESINELLAKMDEDSQIAKVLEELGFTTEVIKEMRAEMIRLRPSMSGFEQMRDTFDDVNIAISEASRSLREMSERPIVSASVMRQVRDMGPEGRAELARQLGVEEDQIAFKLAEQQLAVRQINESVTSVLSIRQNERKELEAINKEAEDLLEIMRQYPEVFKLGDLAAVERNRLREVQNLVTDATTNIRSIYETQNDFILDSQQNTLARERENLRRQYAEQLRLIRDFIVQRVRLDGELTETTIAEANRMAEQVASAYRKMEKDLEETYGRQLNLTMMVANSMESAFQQFFSDPFEEGLAGLVVSFARAMQQMLAQWMAFQATVGLLNVISPSGTLANRFLGSRGMAPQTAASGGYISGPGTSTSDSIPAMLSNGEYVIKASTVDRLGVRNLDALNNMRGFARGGVVGSGRSGELMGGGDVINNVSIVLNTDGSSRAEEGDQRELGRRIEQAVLNVLITEKRPGGLLSA